MGRFGDFIRDFFGSGYNNIFDGTLNGHSSQFLSDVGSGAKNWFTGVTGSGLTPSEMAANEFSHNEAELARQWQENFYNQYQSPAAQVRQYQEAGLNPALMYGSAPSSSPVSSSAPSSVSPSASPMALLQLIPGLAKLKSEIDNVRADTLLKRDQGRLARAQSTIEEIRSLTEAPLRDLERQLKEQGVELNEIDIKYNPQKYEQALRRGEVDIEQARIMCAKALYEINQLRADTALTLNKNKTEELIQQLTAAQTVLAEQNSNFVSLQAMEQAYSNKIFRETGNKPGTNIWGLIPGIGTRFGEILQSGSARRAQRIRRHMGNLVDSGTD